MHAPGQLRIRSACQYHVKIKISNGVVQLHVDVGIVGVDHISRIEGQIQIERIVSVKLHLTVYSGGIALIGGREILDVQGVTLGFGYKADVLDGMRGRITDWLEDKALDTQVID